MSTSPNDPAMTPTTPDQDSIPQPTELAPASGGVLPILGVTPDTIFESPNNSQRDLLNDGRLALRGLTREELEAFCKDELGQGAYRGRQIFKWLHVKQARNFDEMTDLSRTLRARLEKISTPHAIEPYQAFESVDGTTKFTFKLKDDAVIESVVIPAKKRVTLCISSQVGCAMGCRFCLTSRMKLVRHLTAGEIVEQVSWAKTLWEDAKGRRISNIVFMGMGEPLHNYDAVTRALRIILDDHGLNFSRRKVTVSTSGLVPAIERLGAEPDISVNLAISLNATTDEIRDDVMPVNKKWNIECLLSALRAYPLEPRQRITFEYVLLGGLNDTIDDAKRLITLLKGIPHKVNLIPWNPFPGAPYRRPVQAEIWKFQKFLIDRFINVTVRETRGLDAMAACGQLGQPGKANGWRDRIREARKAARIQKAAAAATSAPETPADEALLLPVVPQTPPPTAEL